MQSFFFEKRGLMKEVYLYTDGACRGNPGPGGWGAILVYGRYEKEMSGGEPLTTNIVIGIAIAIVAVTFMISVTKR